VIICDTGPIFAAADRKDADHHACVDLFTGLRLAGRRLLVPQTVMAEVGYMLATKLGTSALAAGQERDWMARVRVTPSATIASRPTSRLSP